MVYHMFEKESRLDWKPEHQERGDSYLQYAENYKDSMLVLLKEVSSRSWGHDYEFAPLLFLFRHYLELQLTGLILYGSVVSPSLRKNLNEFMAKSRTNHSLVMLYEKLKEVEIDKKYWTKELNRLITNFDKLDNRSDRFRYPERNDGNEFYTNDKYFEANFQFYIELTTLSTLKEHIEYAVKSLESLEGYFDSKVFKSKHLWR